MVFIIGINHDARSSECQINEVVVQVFHFASAFEVMMLSAEHHGNLNFVPSFDLRKILLAVNVRSIAYDASGRTDFLFYVGE